MIQLTRLWRSFLYAGNGIRYAFRHEQNFRIQVGVASVVIGAGFLLDLSTLRFILLLFLVTLVLILELMNTFFEKMIDVVEPRVHHYAAVMKDLLAATVLLASVAAIVIGALIFWPYVF